MTQARSLIIPKALPLLLTVAVFPFSGAQAQRPPPQAPTNNDILSNPGNLAPLTPASVTVNVREANGMPLEGHAFVRLSSEARHYNATVPAQDNAGDNNWTASPERVGRPLARFAG